MAAQDRTFRIGNRTMHAVLLRQPSRSRWNAFFWGGGFSQANTFARREGAERWLRRLVERHLPTLVGSSQATEHQGR